MFRLYFKVPPLSHNVVGFEYVVYNLKNGLSVGVRSLENALDYIDEGRIKWDWFVPTNYENLHFVEISSKEELISLYPELFV